jgi:hypothetical protein
MPVSSERRAFSAYAICFGIDVYPLGSGVGEEDLALRPVEC